MRRGYRTTLLAGSRLAFTAAIAIWTIDVLLNLALAGNLLVEHQLHARPLDFAGLFLAGLPLALAAALGSLIAAPILARMLRRADPQREAVALLAAALAAAAVFAQLARSSSRAAIIAAVAGAGLAALAVYLGLRGRGDDGEAIRAGELSRHVLLVPLCAGFITATGAGLLRGERGAALLALLQAAVVAGLFVAGRRGGRLRQSGAPASVPPLVAVLLGLLACALGARYGEPDRWMARSTSAERPNIVLIVLDTVRADHLQRYGYTRNTMPALERWAADSFTFLRAVSPAGWTSPAHASIFSGLTVSRHGVHYAGGVEEAAPLSTPAVAGVSWLPDRLSEEGYYCLAVTANRLAVPEGVSGFARVLAPSRDPWSGLTLGSLTDRVLPPSGRLSERLGWRMPYVDAGGIVDVAMRALPGDTGPVFLFLNVLDAHAPYNPPAGALALLDLSPGHLFDRYQRHRQLTLLWDSLPAGKERYLADLYDGELRWIDLHVERFLRFIDERLGPNTVVVVTSDHGEELGEAGRVGHEFGLSQRLIHVPLFVKGPALPSGESAAPVSLRTLFTFIDRLGAGAGADLNTLQEGDEFGNLSERYPSGHNQRVLGSDYARPWVSLIEGGLKGIGPSSAGWSVHDVDSNGFDHESAATGVAGEDDLRARIDAYWERYQDRRMVDEGDLSEEELRRLRSLGYVK